jgi:peptidoglycan/LPS O-acetylase OafA/YrhL
MARETINCLQAGRAVAALAVVMCHASAAAAEATAGIPGWLRWAAGYGWLGVDFFFVLSGFIMAYSHRELSGGGLARYARGRLARVLVPYVPVGVAVAALYTLVPPGGDRDWNWLASATLIPGSGTPALDVAWTLQFELVFYAVFGLSLAAGRPFAGVTLWVVAAVLYTLLVGEAPARFNPYLNPIIVEFLFGMAAAKMVSSERIERPLLAAAAAFLSYAMLGGGSEARALFALAMAFLVVTLVRAERSGALRVPGALVFLGGASYALYLVHSPLVAIGAGLFDHWLLSLAGALSIGVGVGVAYHLWWEAPMLRRTRASRSRASIAVPVTV